MDALKLLYMKVWKSVEKRVAVVKARCDESMDKTFSLGLTEVIPNLTDFPYGKCGGTTCVFNMLTQL